jgi:hypothetical protein
VESWTHAADSRFGSIARSVVGGVTGSLPGGGPARSRPSETSERQR